MASKIFMHGGVVRNKRNSLFGEHLVTLSARGNVEALLACMLKWPAAKKMRGGTQKAARGYNRGIGNIRHGAARGRLQRMAHLAAAAISVIK